MIELRRLDQRPDLPLQGRRLGRVHGGDVAGLIQQLLEPSDVAVGLGPRHRRHEVIDNGGVRPAFGLGAFPGIVDQEGIDERDGAEGGVGAAGGRHAEVLARQPFQVAVLPMCTNAWAPNSRSIHRYTAGSGGWEQGSGSWRSRSVLPETAGRMHQDHDVAACRWPRRSRHGVAVRSTKRSPGASPRPAPWARSTPPLVRPTRIDTWRPDP